MPAERVVNCPKCNEPKTTRAARNNRLACFSCGAKFLAPAPPPVEDEVTEARAPKKTSPPTRSSSGASVKKATSTTIKKNAKVRKAKTVTTDGTTEAPPVDSGDAPTDDKTVRSDPYEPPKGQADAKKYGRRGGLGRHYYSKFRKDKAS